MLFRSIQYSLAKIRSRPISDWEKYFDAKDLNESDVQFLVSSLNNPNLDPNVKADLVVCIIQNNKIFSDVANEMSIFSSYAEYKISGMMRAVLKNCPDTVNAIQFLNSVYKQSPNLAGLIPLALYEPLVSEFSSSIKEGKMLERVSEIFGEPYIKSYLNQKILGVCINSLDDNSISAEVKKRIFESVFVIYLREGDPQFPVNHRLNSILMTYLMDSWQEHKEYLKEINPILLKSFIVGIFVENEIDMVMDFLSEETRELFVKENLEGQYQALAEALIKLIVKTPSLQMTDSMLSAMLQIDFSEVFAKEFPKMIFWEPLEPRSDKEVITRPGKVTVVQNNEGYFNVDDVRKMPMFEVEQGALLSEKKSNSPIGYNIHLPPAGVNVESVIVHFYGGTMKDEKNKIIFLPGHISNFEKYLLNQGTAVVQLNLPDLLKLDDIQAHMPETLHTEIHDCINQFFQTITTDPKTLHPSLETLKDKKLFLYGASFGGGMVVRHAEMFPGTFDGYISHDGGIDAEALHRSSIFPSPRTKGWLDPAQKEEMEKITEPLLLIQAMDDNNVNVEVLTEFVRKFPNPELLKLCILRTGNPIPSKEEPHNKGHFIPAQKEDFIRYAQTVLQFERNVASLPIMTDWRALRTGVLAKKFYKEATLTEKYIAEVFDLAQKHKHQFGHFEENWTNYYRPLFYAMWHANRLANDKDALKNEIKKLKEHGVLNEKVISNLLNAQSSAFEMFAKEYYLVYYGRNIPDTLDINKLLLDKTFIHSFMEKLDRIIAENPKTAQYFLQSLYQNNPTLLEPLYKEYNNDPDCMKALDKAKNGVEAQFKKESALIRRVWQKTAQAVSERKKENYETCLKILGDTKANLPSNPFTVYSRILILAPLVLSDSMLSAQLLNAIEQSVQNINGLGAADRKSLDNLIAAKLCKAILSRDQNEIDAVLTEASKLYTKASLPDDYAAGDFSWGASVAKIGYEKLMDGVAIKPLPKKEDEIKDQKVDQNTNADSVQKENTSPYKKRI